MKVSNIEICIVLLYCCFILEKMGYKKKQNLENFTFASNFSRAFSLSKAISSNYRIGSSISGLHFFDGDFVTSIWTSVLVNSDTSIFSQRFSIFQTINFWVKTMFWIKFLYYLIACRFYVQSDTHNSTAGLGFPWTCTINAAVDSRIRSDSRSFTRYTGAWESCLAFFSAAETTI